MAYAKVIFSLGLFLKIFKVCCETLSKLHITNMLHFDSSRYKGGFENRISMAVLVVSFGADKADI